MVSGRGCPGHRGPPTRPGRPPSPHVQPVAAVAVQHPGVGEGEPAPPGTERPVSAGRARSPRALAGTHDTPPPPWAHPALPDRGKEPGPKGRPRRRVRERGPCSEPLPGRRPPGGQSKAQPRPSVTGAGGRADGAPVGTASHRQPCPLRDARKAWPLGPQLCPGDSWGQRSGFCRSADPHQRGNHNGQQGRCRGRQGPGDSERAGREGGARATLVLRSDSATSSLPRAASPGPTQGLLGVRAHSHLRFLTLAVVPAVPGLGHQQGDEVALLEAQQRAVVTSGVGEDGLDPSAAVALQAGRHGAGARQRLVLGCGPRGRVRGALPPWGRREAPPATPRPRIGLETGRPSWWTPAGPQSRGDSDPGRTRVPGCGAARMRPVGRAPAFPLVNRETLWRGPWG